MTLLWSEKLTVAYNLLPTNNFVGKCLFPLANTPICAECTTFLNKLLGPRKLSYRGVKWNKALQLLAMLITLKDFISVKEYMYIHSFHWDKYKATLTLLARFGNKNCGGRPSRTILEINSKNLTEIYQRVVSASSLWQYVMKRTIIGLHIANILWQWSAHTLSLYVHIQFICMYTCYCDYYF